VWNRQRKDEVLLDVEDVALGCTTKMRWNDTEQWIWSEEIVHTPSWTRTPSPGRSSCWPAAAEDPPSTHPAAPRGSMCCDQVVSAPDFRGRRYLGADLALAEQAHPAHAITRRYRQALHQLLAREVRRLGLPRPAHVTDQLMLLIEGTLATGAARPASRPARARELAQRILG
jgi:hypothetical protein